VIVRRKAGRAVEFGNTLFLAEQRDGLIVDWELFREPDACDTCSLPGDHNCDGIVNLLDLSLLALHWLETN